MLEKYPEFVACPPIPKNVKSVPVQDLKEILEKNNREDIAQCDNEDEMRTKASELGFPDSMPRWGWPLFLDSYKPGGKNVSLLYTFGYLLGCTRYFN